MARVDKTEAYLNTLPAAHQDMLEKYRDNLYRIRYCIDENFQIIRKLIEDVGNLFENANQTVLPNPYQNGYDEGRVRTQDLDKVKSRPCAGILTNSIYSFVLLANSRCKWH